MLGQFLAALTGVRMQKRVFGCSGLRWALEVGVGKGLGLKVEG